jgi:ElaA protein
MGSWDVHVDAFDDLAPRTAYLLWQLRSAAFVVEQDCPYLDLDGRDLEPTTRHVWVGEDDLPMGYARVLDDGDALRIGRVVVEPTHRGTGLSDALMRAVLEVVGDRPSRLDAQAPLAGWYARHGYAVTGPEFLEDGIPHLPMARPANRD